MAVFGFLPSGARLMTGLENRVMIEVEAFPETTTIVVKGELDLVTRPYLAAQLVLAVQDRPGRLVFDLSGTHFMDCGSARLITAAGQWLPDGVRPVIRRPRPGVRRVFELTGLEAYCEIEPLTVGSNRALASCPSQRTNRGADR